MINYKLLNDSVEYYESLGYQRIETPWMVSEYVDNITKPADVPPFVIGLNGKHLVASGEQSFLELYLKNYLPIGAFITVTPCFRYEKRDDLHCKHFMKSEVIITQDVNEESLKNLVETAMDFFEQYFDHVQMAITDIGYDIVVDEFELGSYGIRESDHLKWIYGTACAEPRLSTLIKRFGKENIKNKYGISH